MNWAWFRPARTALRFGSVTELSVPITGERAGCGFVVVSRARVAILVRLQVSELLDFRARLLARVGVPVALLDHLLEGIRAADPQDEIGPQVHRGPHVFSGDRERRDALGLDLAH